MPRYRITLRQALEPRPWSAIDVTYTYRNGPPQNWFFHDAIGKATDTSVIVVSSGTDLVNQPDVLTRTLNAYYPTDPTERQIAISSVQPA